MNLMKLNNESRDKALTVKKLQSTIKEERRRTGRYIAILVGICLFLLAIYHAWVRRIPVVASLVVPALIMFVYVGWVLYTAARDKQKFLLLDAEAALNAAADGIEAEIQNSEAPNNIEISIISSPESPKANFPEESKHSEWAKISTAFINGEKNTRAQEDSRRHIMPIILVNDRPPDDLDQTWVHIVEALTNSEKFKNIQTRRKFKRRFCRSRRYAAFKRSYSIA